MKKNHSIISDKHTLRKRYRHRFTTTEEPTIKSSTARAKENRDLRREIDGGIDDYEDEQYQRTVESIRYDD